MALVKFGPTITDARGSIAGTTFSRNRSGAYIRARVVPVNPSTEYQQTIRNILTQIVERWRSTLTAAQRTAWGVYAAAINIPNKLGENQLLTGFNHFVRSNTAIMQAGGTVVDDGPTELSLPEADSTFALSASEASQNLSITFDNGLEWANEDGGYMLIKAGIPKSATRNFFKGPWRYAGKIEGDGVTPPTSPATIASPYPVAAGQKIWVEARIARADGRLSAPFRTVCTVGA